LTEYITVLLQNTTGWLLSNNLFKLSLFLETREAGIDRANNKTSFQTEGWLHTSHVLTLCCIMRKVFYGPCLVLRFGKA